MIFQLLSGLKISATCPVFDKESLKNNFPGCLTLNGMETSPDISTVSGCYRLSILIKTNSRREEEQELLTTSLSTKLINISEYE